MRPNLLLCFDAFGTLFKPKLPVAQQYGQVARQLGITGFHDDELNASLRAAMKTERAKHPNYGKTTGLGATRWWTNVIHGAFQPLIGPQELPPELAPALIRRFSSREAYDAAPGLASALKTLKSGPPGRLFNDVVVGVVTNSDDRVPSVLASFGVDVGGLRCGVEAQGDDEGQAHDVDFHCMSYDVGFEKPHRIMFDVAERMLTRIVATRGMAGTAWRKVHVGDEYDKDVLGATGAGWRSVLVDAEEAFDGDMPWVEGHAGETLDGVFERHAAARVRSIEGLVTWLTGEKSASAR